MVETIRDGEHYVTVHGYASEEAYRAVVDSDGSPFNRAAAESRIEEYGRWVSSSRGETVSYDR
jgi:hypothetical protein